MSEEWKPIQGFENLYEVSNFGRVRSLDRHVYTSLKYFPNGSVMKGKIISGNKGEKHYMQVCLFDEDHKKHFMSVHRLVANAFIPNSENKPQVNHIDGNKQNNNVSNLEWVTPSENLKHAFDTGLSLSYGENSPNAKLTYREVEEIRRTYKKGDKEFGRRGLAKKYGVVESTIYCILKGKAWRR